MTYSPHNPSSPDDKFKMSEHVDKLTPAKGKNKYYCPVCNGNDLSVNLTTNAYTCYNGCDRAAIREAVSPIAEKQITEQKAVRPKSDRTWTYTNAEGREIVRTRRIDYGDGTTKRRIWQEYFVPGRWVAVKGSGSKPSRKFEPNEKESCHWVAGSYLQEEIKAPLKKTLVPYRWQEIQSAIAEGKTIFWVEGEPCADAMWSLGLPATTTIGGTDGLINDDGSIPYGDYSKLFEGASLVICPDRDQGGIKYAEKLAAMYPVAKWLYAFPESPVWKALPKDKGLDVADWIESGATVEQIVSAIEDKRSIVTPIATSNVLQFRGRKPEPEISVEELGELALALAQDDSITGSRLQTRLTALASKSGRPKKEVFEIYEAHRKELQLAEADVSEVAKELLELQRQSLSAHDYFHSSLADLLEDVATAMPTATSWLVTTLLPALGSSMGVKSRLVIKASSNYVVSPIVWSMIVASSGKKKSPAQAQIVDPLTDLELESFNQYKSEFKAYQKEVNAAARSKDRDSEPAEPPQRTRYVTQDSTPEGLMKVLSESPELLIYRDELAGFFKSMNAYKSGKGGDEQFWLTAFNGKPTIGDRATIERSTVAGKSNVSMTGSIQWAVLQDLQSKSGDFADASGMFARFLVVGEEAPASLLEFDDEFDGASPLPMFLRDLYLALRDQPEQDYILSTKAKALFKEFQHKLVHLGEQEDHPGLANVYPKMETYAARFALILHVTNAIIESKYPEPAISGETMQKAIRLAKYYLGQARLVYGVNDPSDKEGNLVYQIVTKARQSGGKVSLQRLKLGVRELNGMAVLDIQRLMNAAEKQGLARVEKEHINGKEVWSLTTETVIGQVHQRILAVAKRKGSVTAGIARNAVYALKDEKYKNDSLIWALFQDLADCGLGEVVGEGRNTKLVVDASQDEESEVEVIEESPAPEQQLSQPEVSIPTEVEPAPVSQAYRKGDLVLYCGQSTRVMDLCPSRMTVLCYKDGKVHCLTDSGQEFAFVESDLKPFPT